MKEYIELIQNLSKIYAYEFQLERHLKLVEKFSQEFNTFEI